MVVEVRLLMSGFSTGCSRCTRWHRDNGPNPTVARQRPVREQAGVVELACADIGAGAGAVARRTCDSERRLECRGAGCTPGFELKKRFVVSQVKSSQAQDEFFDI